MPLPTNPKLAWPPTPFRKIQHDLDRASAWYSGDTDELRSIYARAPDTVAPRPPDDGFADPTQRHRVRFWARRGADTTAGRIQIHVPAAADIAAVSADLLFGEEVSLRIPAAHADGAPADAIAAQDRLDQLAGESGLANTLLEASEVCAALGGVYLRASWDTSLLDIPFCSVVHADRAVPEFRFGRLTAVTFWRVLDDDDGTVWRHLERHEPGVILHGLYEGRRDRLGRQVDLAARPETADLEPEIRLGDWLGPNALAVRYVPNVRPNRRHRGWPIGRSDFDGTESFMDALDETYTAWMRDIRLGQARILVAREFLETRGRGGGREFDTDREIFTPLDLDPGTRTATKSIEHVQPDIRADVFERTALALFERIVSTAGYSPQTFGLSIAGRAESGTALRVREARTFRTRARKQRYWDAAIGDLAEILLRLDRAIFGRPDVVAYRPTVRFADGIVDDPAELATSLTMFAQAKAMSIRTRVMRAQPELEGPALDAEVQAILDEEGLAVPDPTGMLPA